MAKQLDRIPTPHITAGPDDFAETVLMPGDPLRSKFIAENFFEEPVLVNNIRGVQGYTGRYRGKKVSVMASGMGAPSIMLYAHELFNFYDVENIIRVVTAGSVSERIRVGDVLIGMSACTDSNFTDHLGFPVNYAPACSYELMKKAVGKGEELGISFRVGALYTSDVYYDETVDMNRLGSMGIMAVEMEAAALYAVAARSGKNALAICSVSNSILTGYEMPAEDRSRVFTDMMKLALETA